MVVICFHFKFIKIISFIFMGIQFIFFEIINSHYFNHFIQTWDSLNQFLNKNLY